MATRMSDAFAHALDPGAVVGLRPIRRDWPCWPGTYVALAGGRYGIGDGVAGVASWLILHYGGFVAHGAAYTVEQIERFEPGSRWNTGVERHGGQLLA